MSALTVEVFLTKMVCSSCAGVFAISQEYLDNARRLGGFKQVFACPYCKSERGYGKGKEDELRDEIERLKQEKQRADNYASIHRDAADRLRSSNAALKGVITKERKRVSNGVCPCCNRQFTNLLRHMKCKHPNHALCPL